MKELTKKEKAEITKLAKTHPDFEEIIFQDGMIYMVADGSEGEYKNIDQLRKEIDRDLKEIARLDKQIADEEAAEAAEEAAELARIEAM